MYQNSFYCRRASIGEDHIIILNLFSSTFSDLFTSVENAFINEFLDFGDHPFLRLSQRQIRIRETDNVFDVIDGVRHRDRKRAALGHILNLGIKATLEFTRERDMLWQLDVANELLQSGEHGQTACVRSTNHTTGQLQTQLLNGWMDIILSKTDLQIRFILWQMRKQRDLTMCLFSSQNLNTFQLLSPPWVILLLGECWFGFGSLKFSRLELGIRFLVCSSRRRRLSTLLETHRLHLTRGDR
mmetsp:Transcript_9453/g.29157  ORF Transcript_9453/g.29157 Transcript_9453/m.29157 type:complete len:242 (+) Transcript_9453:598-1323(+)